MKKRIAFLIPVMFAAFLIICFFSVMNQEKRVSGIENYEPAYCSLSLTQYLFPCEDFPDRFDYTEADFQYYYHCQLTHSYATAFSFFRYTPQLYTQAKAFCLRNLAPTDERQYRIGNYTFIEHLCHKDKDADGTFVVKCQYPEHFNMFTYDDSSNTLLFLGYYNSDPESVSTPLALNDFESFYQTHFSQYYTLDQ